MELIRKQKLEKVPGVAETLDWARSLVTLHQDHLDPEMVEATLGIVFKDRLDVEHVKGALSDLLEKVGVKIKELPVE
jgi:MoxR-like ATPase